MPHKLNSEFIKSEEEVNWKHRSIYSPRHRWYSYKEGFSPKVVDRALIEAEVRNTDLVLDPFNGGGTTTLCCALNGIPSVGIEVNPFSRFVSQVKQEDISLKKFDILVNKIYQGVEIGHTSELLTFSTFSELGNNREKWLFNSTVLNSFEGGRQAAAKMPTAYKNVFTLALIGAAMDTANAAKDGKCLKYKNNWTSVKYDKYSFLAALKNRLSIVKDDVSFLPSVAGKATLIRGDCRTILTKNNIPKFKLCITSPPYLNSFDYTDIYRPELFLGRFISTHQQLRGLRSETLRSHVEIKIKSPVKDDFGLLYHQVIKQIFERVDQLWDKQIPVMIQSYFEDIQSTLKNLKDKAAANAHIWIVVSNSAYVGVEIPVDLIIADIGAKLGLFLREIGVLRYVSKRKSKYSSEIDSLRESIIIFTINKH